MFSNDSQSDFKTLVRSLEFKNPLDFILPLLKSHLEQAHERLANFVSTEVLIDATLRQSLASLPDGAIMSLVASPYLCEFLMILEDPAHEISEDNALLLRTQIIQGLVAEIRCANPSFSHQLNPKWTFNGDTVLDASVRAVAPALRTSCGIALNYQSYAQNTGRNGIGGYDHATALKHKERIEAGLDIIGATSEHARELVELVTTVIQFRYNQNHPNVINSSTHTSIGLIRCDNFHKLHGDLPEVVDMLVHESIHQYLHLFEEQLFSFVHTDKIPKTQIVERAFASPWSGKMLDLRSYTHAILVWHGLRNFWKQVLDSGFTHPEITSKQAHAKLAEAEYGFVNSQSVLDNLGEFKNILDIEYKNSVNRMQPLCL